MMEQLMTTTAPGTSGLEEPQETPQITLFCSDVARFSMCTIQNR